MEEERRGGNKEQEGEIKTRGTSRRGKIGEGSIGKEVERWRESQEGKELGGKMEREKRVKGDLDMETLNEHRLLHDADSLVLE